MNSNGDKVSLSQADYYGTLLNEHGVGVDAVASGKQVYKDLRYEKLSGVFQNDNASSISVHDVGFGLGHFKSYLQRFHAHKTIAYSGSEVTPGFVEYAHQNLNGEFYLRDISMGVPAERYDYLIFGGTFYHLAGANPDDYIHYVCRTLKNAYAMCSKGLAFNLVTEFVEYRNHDLFYAGIGEMSSFVAKEMSRFFTINHCYPLYEYTVCVYKEEFVAAQYQESDFDKYFKGR